MNAYKKFESQYSILTTTNIVKQLEVVGTYVRFVYGIIKGMETNDKMRYQLNNNNRASLISNSLEGFCQTIRRKVYTFFFRIKF